MKNISISITSKECKLQQTWAPTSHPHQQQELKWLTKNDRQRQCETTIILIIHQLMECKIIHLLWETCFTFQNYL